jgi:hypothetical protein
VVVNTGVSALRARRAASCQAVGSSIADAKNCEPCNSMASQDVAGGLIRGLGDDRARDVQRELSFWLRLRREKERKETLEARAKNEAPRPRRRRSTAVPVA